MDLLATVEFMSDGGNAAQVVRQVRTGGACTHPPAATGYMPAPPHARARRLRPGCTAGLSSASTLRVALGWFWAAGQPEGAGSWRGRAARKLLVHLWRRCLTRACPLASPRHPAVFTLQGPV